MYVHWLNNFPWSNFRFHSCVYNYQIFLLSTFSFCATMFIHSNKYIFPFPFSVSTIIKHSSDLPFATYTIIIPFFSLFLFLTAIFFSEWISLKLFLVKSIFHLLLAVKRRRFLFELSGLLFLSLISFFYLIIKTIIDAKLITNYINNYLLSTSMSSISSPSQ